MPEPPGAVPALRGILETSVYVNDLAASPIDDLKEQIEDGIVLLPDDPRYDEARTIWNAMIDRRPAVIVRCQSEKDVMRAVAFARANEIPLSVRGGGHNIAGHAVCDDGVMVDLSRMNFVHVDPAAQRASVGPGALLSDFDKAAQKDGLATPLGINSTTGVAGLTLGGGFGWLTRKYGLTVDNLLAARVVMADGELMRASEQDSPDLFWALRGGGGNFGVVTQFEFALHPVGPNVLAGLMVFSGLEAEQVLRNYRQYIASAPDELSVWAVLRGAPPLPFLPPEVHGQLVFNLMAGYARRLPSPHCEIFLGQLGGQAARVAPEATAFGNRDANFV